MRTNEEIFHLFTGMWSEVGPVLRAGIILSGTGPAPQSARPPVEFVGG
jgi:hypothetical protein